MLLEWTQPPPFTRATPGISPDGSLLVLPHTWSDTYIYDTETWEVVASINMASVATVFSPDGTKLAVSSSWDIQIWDVAELLVAGSE
jgi:Tol biopolymer transport system component